MMIDPDIRPVRFLPTWYGANGRVFLFIIVEISESINREHERLLQSPLTGASDQEFWT